MEDFDLGLEGTVIEMSLDFDESREEPPKTKCRQKAVTKKEREHLVKEIGRLLLTVTTSHCLDTTCTKLKTI